MRGSGADETFHRSSTSYWQLQDAKARFSEVVRRAVEQGPQHVTVNGEERAVVVSAQEYDRLMGHRTGRELVKLLAESPLADLEFEHPPFSGPVRNVLSELRRKLPEPAVEQFVAEQPLSDLYVSEVTFAEIRFGIELIGDPKRRSELHHWLDQRLRPLFDRRALPITEDILLQWRLMIESGRKPGHTFSHPDVLIAATAAQHGLTVVTRNTREFNAADIAVFNPWKNSI